ncbi:MAG: insulinase family protein, partial [Candidatus Zambryskibacteria bacterium]|nr:insulinase family protein [Candidatus Zambryskibacteria bacterium]
GGFAFEDEGDKGKYHILEHYLVGSILENSDYKLQLDGEADMEGVEFYLTTTKKGLRDDLKFLIDGLTKPNFKNKKILLKESEAVQSELEEYLNSKEGETFWAARGLLLGKDCPYVRTHREEVKIAKKISLEELGKFYREKFKRGKWTLVVSAYAPEKNIEHIVEECLGNSFCDEGKKLVYPECEVKTLNEIRKPITNVSGAYVYFTFPGMSFENSVLERLAINIICSTWLSSNKGQLFKQLRQSGIYGIDYNTFFFKRMGMVIFSAHVPLAKVDQLTSLVRNGLNDLIANGVGTEALDDRKKSDAESWLAEWDSNEERHNWIVQDIVQDGTVYPPEKLTKILGKINQDSIQKVIKKIINPNKLSVIVLSGVSA